MHSRKNERCSSGPSLRDCSTQSRSVILDWSSFVVCANISPEAMEVMRRRRRTGARLRQRRHTRPYRRDVDRTELPIQGKDKSDHIAGKRLDAGGPMPRRRCRDPQRDAIRLDQVSGFPWRQAFGILPEPFRSGNCREHAPGLCQKAPARMVKIVGMLVVAQQHGIDRPDLFRTQRWPRGFSQDDVRQTILALRAAARRRSDHALVADGPR